MNKRRKESAPRREVSAASVVAGGAAARLASLPVSAIATAITAHLTIQYVGEEYYGYVSLVATLFLLLPFADFGLGVVVINAIARLPPGHPPTSAELRIIWRVLLRLVAIALVLIVIVFVIAFLRGWSTILNVPPELPDTDYITAGALAVYFVAIPLSVGQRVLVGLGRAGEMTITSVIAPVTTTACTGVFIAVHASPMYLGLAPAIGLLFNNIVMSWRALIHLGVGLRQLQRANPEGPPERLAHSALSFFVVSLGLPIAMQSDRLILANYSTAAELSTYSLMAQMYVPTLSVITIGSLALWPAYKRRGDDARTLWVSSLRTLALAGLLIGAIFGILSPLIASIISSDEIRPDPALAASFAALIFVMAVQQATGQLLTDEGGLRFQAYCVAALAVISLAVSIVLAGPLGAVGPVIASIIAVTVAQLVPGIIRAHKSFSGGDKSVA